jgi:cysteinyl-tRNA synthetase
MQTPTVDTVMDALLLAREDARKRKDWNTADRIRNRLGMLGFEIQDTDRGPVWRKK